MAVYPREKNAGRKVMRVNPHGSSQRCPCGAVNRRKVSSGEHACVTCVLSTSRGHGSALEIHRLGLSPPAATLFDLEYVASQVPPAGGPRMLPRANAANQVRRSPQDCCRSAGAPWMPAWQGPGVVLS